MPKFHVGCAVGGIYAGVTHKGSNHEWMDMTNVTGEAIGAVITYMYNNLPKDEDSIAYYVRLKNGKYARLKLEIADVDKWKNEHPDEGEEHAD